jgi:hypothetical protein
MARGVTKSSKQLPALQVGIVGFGLSGQVFHAPFIDVHPGFNLHTIVTTGVLAKEKYPAARILSSFDELIADPGSDHLFAQFVALSAGKGSFAGRQTRGC